MRILKYSLPIEREFSLSLPKYAKLLAVQSQEDRPTLWALVYDETVKAEVPFRMYGTGWEITPSDIEGMEFIGTVQSSGFVWHYWMKSPWH